MLAHSCTQPCRLVSLLPASVQLPLPAVPGADARGYLPAASRAASQMVLERLSVQHLSRVLATARQLPCSSVFTSCACAPPC